MARVRAYTPLGRKSITVVPPALAQAAVDGGEVVVYESRRLLGASFGRRLRRQSLTRLSAIDRSQVECGPACGQFKSLVAAGVVVTGPSCRHMALPESSSLVTAEDWEWASVSARTDAWLYEIPSVSVLLCTSRPELLDFALGQLVEQSYENLEVVVVAHGFELPPVHTAFSSAVAAGLRLEVVYVSRDVTFGEALSRGAQACSGELVTKVDDDDFYGPWHIANLVASLNYSGAELVGKALQYVYLAEIGTSVRLDPASSVSQPEMFSDWVCGGTMLLRKDTGSALGWFDSIPRAVDRNIQDKVLAASGRVYRSHGHGYVYVRRSSGHTYATEWEKYLRSPLSQSLGVWASPGFRVPKAREASAI